MDILKICVAEEMSVSKCNLKHICLADMYLHDQ